MAQPTSSTAGGSTAAPEHHPPSSDPTHEVELFGVPRLLAGCSRIPVCGTTLAEVAANLAQRAPQLAGPVLLVETGWLLPGYSFVVDERFTRDPLQLVPAGASILLVSSAAGG
jgi:hypothetical protein